MGPFVLPAMCWILRMTPGGAGGGVCGGWVLGRDSTRLVPAVKLPDFDVSVWLPFPPTAYAVVTPEFVTVVDWPASSVFALAVLLEAVATLLTRSIDRSDDEVPSDEFDTMAMVAWLAVLVTGAGGGGSWRRWICVSEPTESSTTVFTPGVRLILPPAIRSKSLR